MSITTAKEKLKKELESVKNTGMAKPVIEHLLQRVAESESFAEDVDQEHKTWDKCEKYINQKARDYLKSSSGHVPDPTVYEWAEDYYHLDDKAQAEKEARDKALKEALKKTTAASKKPEVKMPKSDEKSQKNAENVQKVTENAQKPTETPKPKKQNDELDGQMDLLSMFGM